VRAVHPGGVSVSVTQRIRGFVPRLHLAEVLLKNPDKKFAQGKKLKCKVPSLVTMVNSANSQCDGHSSQNCADVVFCM